MLLVAYVVSGPECTIIMVFVPFCKSSKIFIAHKIDMCSRVQLFVSVRPPPPSPHTQSPE